MPLDAETIAVSTDRAAHEWRRGRAVLLQSAEGSYLALAAETLSEAALAQALALAGAAAGAEAALALTAQRGAVLHILPNGHDTLLLPLAELPVPAPERASLIRDLADASRDLAAPLRGPYQRRRGAPPAAAAAAIKLAKVAYLLPAALLIPLGDAVMPDLLVRVQAEAVVAYDQAAAESLKPVSQARLPVADAEDARLYAFRAADGGPEHFALVIGRPDPGQPVLARLHSECFTGDLLGSLRCDCGEQLRGAVRTIREAGGGVLLYMAQEGRGIGLVNKLRAYQLQDEGFDTVEANLRIGYAADERWFLPAARMLQLLGFSSVRLLTNNPEKVDGLAAAGIDVAERVPHKFPANSHNEAYLATKKKRSGHYL
ncbi:GTP cyclohydrolase II [Ferrovibrio sp.]|uniref:GTP cyclohydrolase II n=1 Tax=Ferrovibrio sp. TaxID=1917215 RepID=UPI003D0A7267